MKRMLINATQPEERRLAIVDGQKLLDFETEIEGREQRCKERELLKLAYWKIKRPK